LRFEPQNWQYYERRIELLEALNLIDLAMNVRLQAAQTLDCAVTAFEFEKLEDLVAVAIEHYVALDDQEKAMDALKLFLLCSFEFKRPAEAQHLTLLKAWMDRERYDDSLKSILALCPNITAVNADGTQSMQVSFFCLKTFQLF
jgi:hypothetical protein